MDYKFLALIELNNGFKCEGRIAYVDKIKMQITMINATRYCSETKEKINKEFFPELIIKKDDIKEINKICYEHHSHSLPNSISNIPYHHKNHEVTFLNDGFFDNLEILTHEEAAIENNKYNQKNRETFFHNQRPYIPMNRVSNYKKKNYYSPEYDYFIHNNLNSKNFSSKGYNYYKPYHYKNKF